MIILTAADYGCVFALSPESVELCYSPIYENGNIKLEKNYSNGKLKTRIRFDRGKENGLYEVYFESGQIQFRVNMKDGMMHGIFEAYLENDQVPSKSCYQNEEPLDMSYCEE